MEIETQESSPYSDYQDVRRQAVKALRDMGRQAPAEWEIDDLIRRNHYRLSSATMDLLALDMKARRSCDCGKKNKRR